MKSARYMHEQAQRVIDCDFWKEIETFIETASKCGIMSCTVNINRAKVFICEFEIREILDKLHTGGYMCSVDYTQSGNVVEFSIRW